jgi:general secretion pathway protein F
MPLYAYKGIGSNGKPVSGVKDADSPKMLRQALKRDGVVVTQYDVSKGGKSAKVQGSGLSREVNMGDIFARVKKAEVGAFTRQLATLINAGIPLAQALGAQFEQIENPKFKPIVGEVRTAVNEGSSLADAMAKHPEAFDGLYVSMVRAGEMAGNLDEVLSRLADFQEASQRLKSKVTGAMVYPVIMLVVGFVIMAILMIAVVPRITDMFAQKGEALPLSTRFLIWFSDALGNYWWLMIGGTIGAVILFRRWTKTEAGRPAWHGFLLKLPMVGPLVLRVSIARFCRTLGTMLHAGVPMLRALDTARDIMGNVILQNVVDDAKGAVTEGESLALTLRRSGHFPPTVTHMIAVGEQAGELETMLEKVAESYEEQIDAKLQRLTSSLEPLMIVFMGGAVGFVVYAILRPIMDMSNF